MDSGSYYQPASKDVQISFSKYPGIFFHVWKLEKYTFLLELWSADVWFPPCEEACAHLSRASPSPPRQMRPSPVRRGSKVPSMALDSQTFLSQFFSTWNHKICIMILSEVQNWYSSTFYSNEVFHLFSASLTLLHLAWFGSAIVHCQRWDSFTKSPRHIDCSWNAASGQCITCTFVSHRGMERQEAKPVNHLFMSFPTLGASFVENIAPIHLLVSLWPDIHWTGGNDCVCVCVFVFQLS